MQFDNNDIYDLAPIYIKELSMPVWVSCGYLIQLLQISYLTWILAWISLGHNPVGITDPKYVSNFVSTFHFIAFLMILLMPLPTVTSGVLIIASFFQQFYWKQHRNLLIAFTPALVCLCCFLIFFRDLGGVITWIID